jgi:hypothetical protein
MRPDRRLVLALIFIAVGMAVIMFTFNTGPVPAP